MIDDDDPPGGGPPPDPSVRQWRHPSEIAAAGRAAAEPPAPTSGRSVDAIRLVAGGCLTAAAVLALVATLQPNRSPGQPAPVAAVSVPGSTDDATDIAGVSAAPATTTTVAGSDAATTSSTALVVTVATSTIAAGDLPEPVVLVEAGDRMALGIAIDGLVLLSAAGIGPTETVGVYRRSGDPLPARRLGTDAYADLAVFAVDPAVEPLGDDDTTHATVPPLESGPVQLVLLDGSGTVQWRDAELTGWSSDITKADGHPLVGTADTDAVWTARSTSAIVLVGMTPVALGVDPDGALVRALPIDDALAVARSMAAGERTWLGFVGREERGGVVVASLDPDGPAERAGVLVGDIVVLLGSRITADMADVASVLRDARPGDVVTATIRRGASLVSVEIELDRDPTLPDEAEAAPEGDDTASGASELVSASAGG